jgi:hypothetical protein
MLNNPRGVSSFTKGILEEQWDGVTITKTPLPTNFSALTDPNVNPSQSGYLAVGTRPDICYAVNFWHFLPLSQVRRTGRGLPI